MNTKFKGLINLPRINRWNRKARKHGKKYLKFNDNEKYPAQWRNDWILKRMKKMLNILDAELEVIGFENLPKAPAILIPNHSSSMDPGIIIAALENPNKGPDYINSMPIFLAKSELENHKKSKGYAKLLDTVFIDRKNPRDALLKIDKLATLSKEMKKYQVIFPEGTRTKDGTIGEFKSGAFKTAKKWFMPIVPVTINNAFSLTNLERGKGKLKIQVIFHSYIKPIDFITQDTKQIAKNVKKIIAKSWVKPQGEVNKKSEEKA